MSHNKAVIRHNQVDLTDASGNLTLKGQTVKLSSGQGLQGAPGGDLILDVADGGSFISTAHSDEWARIIANVIEVAGPNLKENKIVRIRIAMSGAGVQMMEVLTAANKRLVEKFSPFRITILTGEDDIIEDTAGIWTPFLVLRAQLRDVELVDLVKD